MCSKFVQVKCVLDGPDLLPYWVHDTIAEDRCEEADTGNVKQLKPLKTVTIQKFKMITQIPIIVQFKYCVCFVFV